MEMILSIGSVMMRFSLTINILNGLLEFDGDYVGFYIPGNVIDELKLLATVLRTWVCHCFGCRFIAESNIIPYFGESIILQKMIWLLFI